MNKPSKFDERLDEILNTYKKMILDDEYGIKNIHTESDTEQAIRTLIEEEVIGEDVKHNHITRVYDQGCQDRDAINKKLAAQRKIVRGE